MTRAVTPIVTGHPGGGQWLSFTPTLPTLDNPSARTLLLAATSERFTTSPLPLIGGSLLLRIDGPAIVIVGVAATNGSPQDFLGGIRVVTTNDPPGNNVHLLPEFTFAFAQTNFGHPAAGNLGSYKKETELTINWNLNQNDGAAAQGSFEAAISGGAFSKTPFQRTAANGFVRIPVQQLSLWVWLQGATDQTRVYLDAIYAYERKP